VEVNTSHSYHNLWGKEPQNIKNIKKKKIRYDFLWGEEPQNSHNERLKFKSPHKMILGEFIIAKSPKYFQNLT
jgi:hypothetical protein